jgi:dihydrofolate synthase/folylpolyglutamate synthase
MSYREALRFLSGIDGMGIRLGLDRLGRVLDRLGRPQDACPAVLIAGTNGKGSVAAMTACVLAAAGLRTGLYTSPHLLDLRERIRVDGRWITEDHLAAHVLAIRDALAGESLTWFEFVTAAAFLEFRRARADIAVLEVGLGGRLDATNLAGDPAVSVITTINREHTAYLGRTLREIAGEKAGVLRTGGTCVTGVRQAPVLRVLEECCRNASSQLLRLGREFHARPAGPGRFSFRGRFGEERDLPCPLPGRHQVDNAAVALAALEVLVERGFPVKEAAVRDGLAATRWEGRMERIPGAPPLLLDGAHNPAAMSVLCRALRREARERRIVFLFGALEDKDAAAMIRRMHGVASGVVFVDVPSDRTRFAKDLEKLASRLLPVPVEACPDVREGLEKARKAAGSRGLVCVTGSLYLVGAVKKLFLPGAEYDTDTPP